VCVKEIKGKSGEEGKTSVRPSKGKEKSSSRKKGCASTRQKNYVNEKKGEGNPNLKEGFPFLERTIEKG